MIPTRRAPFAAVLMALALLPVAAPACAPPPPVRADGTRSVLLLGCRVLGGSMRAADLLNDMAAATDVLGSTRFVVDSPPECRPEDLPALLASHPEASVAIVILGDLSVLDGVDPSLPPHASERLTTRAVPLEALHEVIQRLERVAREQRTALVLATAPIGWQARVEVPELLTVAELVRQHGPHLDLARDFLAREPAPLFSNGFDLLDDYGHDALARVIFEHCLTEDGPFPARDEAERSARLQARALAAFHADREDEFAELAGLALGGSNPGARPEAPASPRHAARLAAIASARDGLVAATPRWNAIEGSAADVPGLALGRALARGLMPAGDRPSREVAETVRSPHDAFEGELVATLDALQRADGVARELALQCVEAHPERLPAWLVLQITSLALPPARDVRAEARRHLALCPRDAVPEALVTRIFRRWPTPVDDLPALLLAERPWAGMAPTGPLLETARRRAALGYIDHALELLRDGLVGLHVPPSWERERQRIDKLPRE